jgi:hypothetical protein
MRFPPLREGITLANDPPMSDLPPIPDSVSGCKVESTLREGPGTVVARARDGLGLPVDLHFFHADTVAPRVPKEIFFEQVRATAAVRSDRLCAVVNAGEKGPWWFVASKGAEGATLAHLFGRGHLDEERALGIFAAMADGLAALEAAGLRHGGLDPQSVALPGAGQVILGLPRFVPIDLAARDPCYLTPEEARGEDWGIASDLFSLGLMLLEGLQGKPAMEGRPEEIRVRLARGTVPQPAALLRGVLPQTVEFLSALLAPDPRARIPSAAAAAQRLRILQAAFSATEALEGTFDAPLAAIPVAGAPAAAAWSPAAAAAAQTAGWAPPLAAPPAPPVPPAPQGRAAQGQPVNSPGAPLRSRRAFARLVIMRTDVEQIHELLHPVVFVGPSEEGRLVARGAAFPGAVARIEVGASVDCLVATGAPPAPRIRGQEIQRRDLVIGDVLEIGPDTVTYEKAERLLPEGAEGTEQERAHRVRHRASKAPLAAGILLFLGVGGWGGLRVYNAQSARDGELRTLHAKQAELDAQYAKLLPLDRDPATGERSVREEAALRLLDRARAESAGGRTRQGQDRLDSLVRQYPDTGAALLAAEELKSLRGSVRLSGADGLRAAQGKADALAAEGKVAEAQDVLLKFADEHRGTYVGDRATQAASTLARIAADRVDDLLAQAKAAADRKDWPGALDAVGRAVASAAPGDALERARKEEIRIRSLVPSMTPGGGSPPAQKPPAPGPEKSPRGGAPPGPEPVPPVDAGAKRAPPSRDEEAAALFRASREALDAGRPGEAERGLYRLVSEYRESRTVRDYGVEIEQRYLDALKKGHGVAGLFHGGVAFKGGRVVLTYKFEDAAEAGDWENLRMFAVPNKATFRIEDGELAAEGAGAFMTRACFRPEHAAMSFRIRPGVPPQDMGAMMAEPKDVANHVLFTLSNGFFKLGKGDKAYAQPGNVIFVFGKGMWRDTDPDMVGFVRTGSSEDPKVATRKWSEIEVSKEGGKARFSVDGRYFMGRSIGDNKYELTGVRPALFVLLTDARFDEVVVEGDLDPEWVKAEHERVFPEIK